ncbi:hypothetical protein HDU87_001343 [Geranomyces variabilis]|uniref:GAF domain-containing protein n=1 Tax=Geranomyces variabilis TaxID=109894 RepID=A0AAD5TSK3_9FUNG|nr:hypothetical protein HDU87_001343 [Geranomyces variabilis]
MHDIPESAYPANDKPAFYALIHSQAQALIDPSLPTVANLANIAALLFYAYNDEPVSRQINWVGFYLSSAATATATASTPTASAAAADAPQPPLTLGPFQGRIACTLIPIGKGVCGTAAASRSTMLVKDVLNWKGHIACDSRSRSELVVPLVAGDGRLLGVFDLDCELLDGFDEEDVSGVSGVVDLLVAACWPGVNQASAVN